MNIFEICKTPHPNFLRRKTCALIFNQIGNKIKVLGRDWMKMNTNFTSRIDYLNNLLNLNP